MGLTSNGITLCFCRTSIIIRVTKPHLYYKLLWIIEKLNKSLYFILTKQSSPHFSMMIKKVVQSIGLNKT